MTRAALTKLLILVILAFIICLPEFFTLHRVSKANFLCLPYRPCEQGNQVKKVGYGKTENAEVKRKDMCDPSQTPDREKWEEACAQENQSNTTGSASDSKSGRDDPKISWFMCETDMDMAELYRNILSSALKSHLEVSVELQLSDAETLKLTLHGRSNRSSLHLHPPEMEEEEKGDEGQSEAFYCCLPFLPTSESASQSRCLLWLANQTVLTATAKETLSWKRTKKGWWCQDEAEHCFFVFVAHVASVAPLEDGRGDEWSCMFRVLWLALLCVVLLVIVTTVIRQVYWGKCLCKKPKVRSVGYSFTDQQLNDGEKQTEIITPNATVLDSYGFQSWSGLSPIQEIDSQNDIETLLDGNVDHCYTANLHHRSHPSTSCLAEEHAW